MKVQNAKVIQFPKPECKHQTTVFGKCSNCGHTLQVEGTFKQARY